MIDLDHPIALANTAGPVTVFNYPQIVSGVLHFAMLDYTRLFIVRVDLRFPVRMPKSNIPGNVVMGRFIKSLRAKVLAQRKRVRKKYGRAHSTKIRFVWVREFGSQSKRPHYHVMLVFNRDAYKSVGDFQSNDDNLARCIQGAWASALGVDFDNHRSLASFSRGGQYQIINGRSLDCVMHAMIYLCKDYTKVWDGSRNIGYSLAREDLLTHRCSVQCLHV